MIDFKKNPKLGVFTYGILLISCLLEISVELGLHEFEDFASHHGLAIFAFGSLFANWDDLTGALKELKKVDDKAPRNVTNALFVGSTSELQKLINGKKEGKDE